MNEKYRFETLQLHAGQSLEIFFKWNLCKQ
jgi:hypothetical protein